jgi:hypothetical protein
MLRRHRQSQLPTSFFQQFISPQSQVASDLLHTPPHDAGTATVTAFSSILADLQVIQALLFKNWNVSCLFAERDCAQAPSAA